MLEVTGFVLVGFYVNLGYDSVLLLSVLYAFRALSLLSGGLFLSS